MKQLAPFEMGDGGHVFFLKFATEETRVHSIEQCRQVADNAKITHVEDDDNFSL